MKKITQLTERKWRTNISKDAYGNRNKSKVYYTVPRKVKSVSPGPRFGHFFVDLITYQVLIYILDYLISLLLTIIEFSEALNLTIGMFSTLSFLLLYPIYYFICELIWQRTLGKLLTKTLVIDENGNKPDLRTLIFRSLIRIVPFEAFSCLGDKNNSYGWHDRWTNTWVVTDKELNNLRKLQEEQTE